MKMKMKSVSAAAFLLSFVLLEVMWCEGCLKEEKDTLLRLNFRFGFPLSWQWDDPNCCEWQGVECNSSTKRVTKLNLFYLWDTGIIDSDWHINFSELMVFKELKSLNLSDNHGIVSCEGNQGFKNLEVLDLSNSYTDKAASSILLCLNELPSLTSLYLSNYYGWHQTLYHRFNLTFIHVFETLSSKLLNLEILDITGHHLTNNLLPSLKGFKSLKKLYLAWNELYSDLHIQGLCSMLKNLEVLDLSYNNFNDSDIASALTGLSSLKSLNLQESGLTPRSIFNISKLRSLEILDLSGNQLNDSILWLIDKDGFTWPNNLQVLKLGSNSFTNKFLSSLSGMGRLKSLDLSENQFEGSLDISGLLSLSNLEILDLSYNQINSLVVHQVSGSKSLSKLDVLALDRNHMINGSTLRESLRPLPSIRMFSMKWSKILGTVVATDFRDLRKLEHLALDGNYDLDSEFFKSIGELTSLKVLSLRGCEINGTLPPADWSKLKKLEELDLSYNEFGGQLPSSFVNMTSLRFLELSQNHFTGKFDSNLASFTSLEHFGFTENQFEVPISFTPFANHSNLKFIYGEGNKLILDSLPSSQTWIPKFQLQVLSLSSTTEIDSLPLPKFLLYQKNLTSLDFTSCRLKAVFPHWLLEKNKKLTELVVRNCSFTGTFQLPLYPLPNIRSIDVSDNNLTGQIPSNISSILPNLEFLDLSRNHIRGLIPSELGQMGLLHTLNLSDNHLSGEIPKNLSSDRSLLRILKLSNNNLVGPVSPSLKYLEELYLDGNSLYGTIPSDYFNSSLINLDMSSNHLVGKIPFVVGNSSLLETLSLSNNHLEGSIPRSLVANLEYLVYLDFSDNNLTGSVPSFADSYVNYIHLSNNRLSDLPKRMFNNFSYIVMLDLGYNEITNDIQDMIQDLIHARLNILILKGNHFTGHLPQQLCQFVDLSILDLSYNNFFGAIPNCLGKIPFENDESLRRTFNGFLIGENSNAGLQIPNVHEKANFTTKQRSYTYTGDILAYMSGIDLSCNKLNGSIPSELGNLTRIRALNLSHNDLTGEIPAKFSNLLQTESLDLSFNMLSGQIPPQLNGLTSLEVFSVAYNNLSGETPERKGQFMTFDESSYEGNPLLCGAPLPKSCGQKVNIFPNGRDIDEDNDRLVDMYVFYVSFGVSYASVLMIIAVILYINPYWRRAWFYYIELVITNCYYWIEDNLGRISNFKKYVTY